jgi:two-component system, cell cycle sensor histidine kinase and response regulator CckA
MEQFNSSLPAISLLYVEDDPVTRETICTVLAKKFPAMSIHTAENGEAGLALFREHRPDIVLTDISMPVMDGIQMARSIRCLNPASNIIVATAISDTHHLLEAIQIGISRYVLKPIDFSMLFEALYDCIFRISMERKIKAQNDFICKLSRAVEQSPSMVVIANATGEVEYVNQRFSGITGYPGEEVIGQNLSIIMTCASDPEPPAQASFETIWSSLACGSEWRGELWNRKKSGELFCEEVSISSLTNDQGEITHFVAALEDVTERKAAIEELKMKSFTIDHIAEEIIWTRPDGSIWKVNDVACQKLGYSREELLSLSIPDLNPLIPGEALQAHLEAVRASGSLKFESFHQTRDGRRYPVEIIVTRIQHEALEYNCAIIRDISEHKKLQKALEDSERQFRTLCDFAPIGIFRTDGAGNNIYNNPRWEEITGLCAAQTMGQGWLEWVHPEDRKRLSEIWFAAIAGGQHFSFEHRQQTPAGGTIWVRTLASPIKGSDGNTEGYVGTTEDITVLQRARQEVLKTQKLESLGLLAGGIAHDFNNLLTGILGNIALARFQLDEPQQLEKRLEDAEKATSRARTLTQQLLTFARGGEPIKKTMELSGLLRETADFVLHGSNVRCEMVLPDDLWPVQADQGQLAQVVHNLVLNAVQAMPEGGTVSIIAGNVSSHPEEKSFVKIAVTDTGTGIAEHHLQKIFDPYFTTKELGSGLGLATCYSIIRKHGGKIRASSTLGRGSTFDVSLPACGREGAPTRSLPQEPYRGSGCVLVMDDEETVRSISRSIMESFGFRVECVEDGAQAVELYRKRKKEGLPFSTVILDLTIPGGVGGKEAIKKLIEIDPQVKAIVSSGYSNDPVMANYREYGFSAVLTKPYRPQEMNEVMRELLG